MSRGYLTYLARARSTSSYYVTGLIEEFSEKDVFLFAQAIAFKVLVSLVPVVVLLAGVSIWIFGDQLLRELQAVLPAFLPAYESQQLLSFLDQLIRTSPQWTPLAALGFLMTAVTLITTVRIAVGNAFEQHWHEQRSLIMGYVFDLRMVLQVGLFFVLTLLITVIFQAIQTEGIELFQWLGLGFIGEGWARFFTLISLLIPFLITLAMFFQLYYFIPMPSPPWLSAGIGAAVAAVLWEVAKFGFALYASHVARFDRYATPGTGVTGEEGVGALASSFGLIIAFVFWVYYSGIVLLLGALIASLHERRRRLLAEEAEIEHRMDKPKLEAAARQTPVNDENERDEEEERAQKELAEEDTSGNPT